MTILKRHPYTANADGSISMTCQTGWNRTQTSIITDVEEIGQHVPFNWNADHNEDMRTGHITAMVEWIQSESPKTYPFSDWLDRVNAIDTPLLFNGKPQTDD